MAPLPSGLPEAIGAEEDLARFLFSDRHYNTTMVKPAAFLPNPTDRESSISRHGKTPLAALWALGQLAARDRTLHGAALFKLAAVQEAGLIVEACEPPDRHAAIRGWPWDTDLHRAKQKEMAAVLASQSELLLREG